MKTKDKKKQASSQGLVPKRRFPEFRDAGDWKVKAFDKLVKVIDGDRGKNYPKADEFSTSGYCVFLNAKNVTKNGFRFEETQFVNKEKDEVLRKGKLQRFDIVLTTRGSVGQFALYSDDIPYNNIRINSGMVILRLKSGEMCSDYLYSFSKSSVLATYIANIAFGNAQQQLTVTEIKKFQLYYPSLPEQQKIADCLSALDELIAAQAQKLDTLKAHKKGLMQQLFPAPGQTTPTLRFPDFRGPWKTKPISSLTPINKKYGIVDGPFGSNLKSIHYRSEGIPIIASGFVTDGVFNPKECLYVDEDKFNQEKRSSVSSGDIVMAKIGARCGASAIMPKGHSTGILSGNALKITVDSLRYSTEFVWQRLWSLYDSGQLPAISIANLKKYLIEIPERNEQEMIANCLSSLDELIAAQARKLDTLKVHKKGLMQQLFPNPDEANG